MLQQQEIASPIAAERLPETNLDIGIIDWAGQDGPESSRIYVLGLAAGPVVHSPFSKIYGRLIVLDSDNLWLTIWKIGCALAPSLGSLTAFRFLVGVGGSAPMTISGGVISDLFPVSERGVANSGSTIGPLFGPVLDPILGGLLAMKAGWRWAFWVLLAACGLATPAILVLNRETNAVIFLRPDLRRYGSSTNRGQRGGGVYPPGMRLATCIIFALFVPISFFWYGWAADQTTHWMVPIVGLVPFGFGMMGILAPIQMFMIDISGRYTASVLDCLTTSRCMSGSFLPLAGPSTYASLGLSWGSSRLGFIGLALIPVQQPIYSLGGQLREKYSLAK
ncbi:hypothetical protein NM208_g5291 [Fusarium decemcellulare]|uniref:Uncharacterized protein n=1 Tax=Fusarium decemcellulare TaxID=57161 RepID=A0ACC1SHT2_9HYPO|nr:hypothetical protein NM208_g5291 [Fusarium decemcellulare]